VVCAVVQKPPKGAYRETRTTQLRRYKEPVDPASFWHMPRFSRYVRQSANKLTSQRRFLQQLIDIIVFDQSINHTILLCAQKLTGELADLVCRT